MSIPLIRILQNVNLVSHLSNRQCKEQGFHLPKDYSINTDHRDDYIEYNTFWHIFFKKSNFQEGIADPK